MKLIAHFPSMYLGGSQVVYDILVSLIDSALQRTPRGGHVHINFRAADGGVVVDVKDTGMEMAEHLIELLQRHDITQQVGHVQAKAICQQVHIYCPQIYDRKAGIHHLT
jgi:hypothetical protein